MMKKIIAALFGLVMALYFCALSTSDWFAVHLISLANLLNNYR